MKPTPPYSRVIQLELNEISKVAIDRLIARGKLPAFAALYQTGTYRTTTSETRYEHLEPWIQWITAHTGKSFQEHGIFHLSNAVHLKHPQIWETLSTHGIESCIVGSMNATRGQTERGFFFPDPWSKDGVTYPHHFQPLWNLISHKVQSHTNTAIRLKDLYDGFRIGRQFQLPLSLYRKIATQFITSKTNPMTRWKWPGLFDLFLFEIFKYLLNNRSYRYYTLFLNGVAHYQHHYWRHFHRELFDPTISTPDCHAEHDPMTYGYEIYDRIIQNLLPLARSPDTLIIIASGLSQEPFTQKEHEGGMNYYRLNHHAHWVQRLGLEGYRVLPMMSRDWQLEAPSLEKLDHAKTLLSGLHVQHTPLFNVTQNSPNSLFIETRVTKHLTSDALIMNTQHQPVGAFHAHFHNIAVKSGHHTGEGVLWLSEKDEGLAQPLPLTEIYPLTLHQLGITAV